MSILLYRKANYMDDNPIDISLRQLDKTFTLKLNLQSIKNNSNYYLVLTFRGWDSSPYCIAPGESHPIIWNNSTYVSTVLITANTVECDNSANMNKINDARRLQITKDIRDVTSNEYKTFNKGWLVLYSEPYYDSSGDVKLIKQLLLNSTSNINMVVKSVINLTDQFYLIYNTPKISNETRVIFIQADTYYVSNLIYYDMKMYHVTAVDEKYYNNHKDNYKNTPLKTSPYNKYFSTRSEPWWLSPDKSVPEVIEKISTPTTPNEGRRWNLPLRYLHPWDDSMAQLVPEPLPMEDTELLQEPETVWFSIYTTLLSVLCIILFVWLISPTAKTTAKYLRRYRETQLERQLDGNV